MEHEFNFYNKYLLHQMTKAEAEHCMSSAFKFLEKARQEFKNKNYDIALIYYKAAAKQYSELSYGTRDSDFYKEFSDKTSDLSEEAGYHLGLCCYSEFEIDDAIYILTYKSGNSTRSMALLALCYRIQTSVPIPEREYSLAYQYMIKVLRDREYAAAPKSELEESVYVAVMIHISEIYREGPTFEACLYKYGPPYKGISPDPRRAAALLRATLANTLHESNRAKLLKALSRYETKSEKSNGIKGIFKNLFG